MTYCQLASFWQTCGILDSHQQRETPFLSSRSSKPERWKICPVCFFFFLTFLFLCDLLSLFLKSSSPVLFLLCVSKFGSLRGGGGASILREESGWGGLVAV